MDTFTLPERLGSRIAGPDDNGCWIWTGYVGKVNGYGYLGRVPAHRVVYEELVGPIPAGLHIDHLCRMRACVNPAHLEPVTNRENGLRGNTISAAKAAQTHCVHGHPFDDVNTYRNPNGTRGCRTCRGIRKRAAYAKRREAT